MTRPRCWVIQVCSVCGQHVNDCRCDPDYVEREGYVEPPVESVRVEEVAA